MHTNMPAQAHLAQGSWPGTALRAVAQMLAASLFTVGSLIASAQQATAHKPVHRHKQASTIPLAATSPLPAPTSIAPAAPKPPDWPVNDRPTEATVVWNSQGLHIEASNSSLDQILKDVATATGAKVEGIGQDQRIAAQRIFGSYGPGSAHDVLVKLLDGSGFNLLLIGDQGQGTPREIVLSAQSTRAAQPTGAAQPVVNDQSATSDESTEVDDQPQPQPQPQSPPNINNGFAPGAPPRTPQQIMQEMQQRQQLILQGNPPQ